MLLSFARRRREEQRTHMRDNNANSSKGNSCWTHTDNCCCCTRRRLQQALWERDVFHSSSCSRDNAAAAAPTETQQQRGSSSSRECSVAAKEREISRRQKTRGDTAGGGVGWREPLHREAANVHTRTIRRTAAAAVSHSAVRERQQNKTFARKQKQIFTTQQKPRLRESRNDV